MCEGMNVLHVVPQVRPAESIEDMMSTALGRVNGSAQPLTSAR